MSNGRRHHRPDPWEWKGKLCEVEIRNLLWLSAKKNRVCVVVQGKVEGISFFEVLLKGGQQVIYFFNCKKIQKVARDIYAIFQRCSINLTAVVLEQFTLFKVPTFIRVIFRVVFISSIYSFSNNFFLHIMYILISWLHENRKKKKVDKVDCYNCDPGEGQNAHIHCIP